MPSGQDCPWENAAPYRPPPLLRRRVANGAGRSSGSRVIASSGLPKRAPPEGDTHVQWHISEKAYRLQRRDRAGITPDFPKPAPLSEIFVRPGGYSSRHQAWKSKPRESGRERAEVYGILRHAHLRQPPPACSALRHYE